MSGVEGNIGVVRADSEPNTTTMALLQTGVIAGVTTFDVVRELRSDEVERIAESERVVRRVGSATPYHQLEAVIARFQESMTQALDVTSESATVRHDRCASALTEIVDSVLQHLESWRTWLADFPEIPPGAETALAGFASSDCVQVAGRVQTEDAPALDLLATPDQEAVLRLADGTVVGVTARLAATRAWAVEVLDAALRLVQDRLDEASRFLLALSAEVLAGTPVVAPMPTDRGWDATFNLGLLDVAAVRAAQSVAWQARVLAADASRKSTRNSDAATQASQTERPGPNPVSPDDQPSVGTSSPEGDSQPRPLPAILTDLSRIVDALVGNVEGLASQWAQRFPADEYQRAMASEREYAASLVVPLQRALQAEEEMARSSGHSDTLPVYPLPTEQMVAWSSDSPDEELWIYQSAATIHALQLYLQSLEQMGAPSKLSVTNGQVASLEFEPARSVGLHASARLLVDVIEENALTLGRLTDRGIDDFGLSQSPGKDTQRLLSAIRTSQAFGLPEASVLYTLRLIHHLGASLGRHEAALVEQANAEVARFIGYENSSKGVVLMIADALARVADRALEHASDGTPSGGTRSVDA